MLLDREIDRLVTEKRDPGVVPRGPLAISDTLILMLALCLALAWTGDALSTRRAGSRSRRRASRRPSSRRPLDGH